MRPFFFSLGLACFFVLLVSSSSEGCILRVILRNRIFPSCSNPSSVCKPLPEEEPCPAPGLLCPFVTEEPSLPLQSTVLDPRPGTGSLLRPGPTAPATPEALLPKQVPITLDPAILASLSSVGGRLDSFLSLVSGVLMIFGGGHALQWVVRAGSGLPRLIGALSKAFPQTPSGVLPSVSAVSLAAPSSMSAPGTS